MNMNNQEGLQKSKKIWIGYPDVKGLHSKMETLMVTQKDHRPTNILLVGESNNGKSLALKKFVLDHPSYVNEERKLIIPVIFVECPPEPNEKRFYDSILSAINAPFKPNEKTENKYYRVLHLLKETDVRILIIDEIHNLTTGSALKQRTFMNVIKYISNEFKISIVCSGTPKALNVFNTDSQLANRFKPFVLKRWEMSKEFIQLLLSFEKEFALPTEKQFVTREVAAKILLKSDGLIGEISEIMELCADHILQHGITEPTIEVLDSIDYLSPQDRYKILRHGS